MQRKIFVFVVGVIILSFLGNGLADAEPLLQWDANPDNITGYRIYYGTTTGDHPDKIEVGNVTQYPLSSLPLSDSKTYYLVVRAFNTAGESTDSNEVSWSAGDNTPPLPPQGVTVE